MLIERLQVCAVIIVIVMFMIVCALLLETTLVSEECENCNYIFHNFSTNCTLGLGSIKAKVEEVQSVSVAVQEVIIPEELDTTIDLNKITYIGDSRFVALGWYGIEQANIFAKEGLNHKQALTQEFVELPDGNKVTLVGALALNENELILVNFGVNGAGWFSNLDFINNYNKLIDIIEDNTTDVTIMLQSILPITSEYENSSSGFPNTRIDELNGFIEEICTQRGHIYLDSSELLKNDNNTLDTKYTSDGLHFNKLGYEVLMEHMSNTIGELWIK